MVISFFSRSLCAVCIPATSFLLPSDSKAAKNPFSVATFSKIQLDYPKEFCQFFQMCKFGLAYSFQVIGPEPACFGEQLTGFFNGPTTNHFLWYTENYLQSSHYKKSKLCLHCISPYTFFPSFLVLFKFSFLLASYSGVIFGPRLYTECNLILCPPPQNNKNSSIDVMQNIF